MWNVFERPSRLRTTNYCEGGLVQRMEHAHKEILAQYLVGHKIPQNSAKNTENQILHAQLGRLPPPQKRKWRLYNDRISALKNSLILGNRNANDYWNTMCHLCQSI